jgi:SPP1 gp7 family putative phage head morphogenesis protein
LTTKDQYIRNQQIIQRRLMKAYAPRVYAALHSQVQAAVAVVKSQGVRSAQGNVHGSIINTEIGGVVTDLYRSAAEQALKKYKPNIKAFGINENLIVQILAYFKKFLLEKVVLPISNTTRQRIDEVLQDAVSEGWTVDQTVKELEDTDILRSRAMTIVRTEAVRAMNFSQLAAADTEDVEMDKQWIAIEDNRVRRSHSHAGVDGQRVAIDDPFSNGLMFPGDPEGSAKETINCRCTLGYFARRDNEGNLIAKTTPPLNILTRMQLNRAA